MGQAVPRTSLGIPGSRSGQPAMPPRPIKSPAIGPPWTMMLWVGLELRQRGGNTYWMSSAFPTFFITTLRGRPLFSPILQKGKLRLRSHLPKFAQGWGGGRQRAPRSSLLQTRCSLGAASTNREKTCPPGEPPTCAVTFQDATELLQELLKLRVLCPQVLAALDG